MPLSPNNLKAIRRFGGQIPPPRKRGGDGGPGVNKQLPQGKRKKLKMSLASGLKLKGFKARKKKKK